MTRWLAMILLVVWPTGAALASEQRPNHLQPISPEDRHGWGQALFDTLLGKEEAECWMLVVAGHQKHYAVLLRVERAPVSEADFPKRGEPLRWVL